MENLMTKNSICLLTLIALTGLTLTGCSSYQNQFDCPPGQGVGCKSVSQVDDMVENGHLGNQERLTPEAKKPLRVWLAPYQDRLGHWHSSSLVVVNREED
jgi:conjugal transfer pilus assembly protein TraV